MPGPMLAIALAVLLGGPPVPVLTPSGPKHGAAAREAKAAPPLTAEAAPSPETPRRAGVPWLPDERMDLVIAYLGITMGKASITVARAEEGATPILLSTRSAGLMSMISFRQTLVSHLDVATMLPRSSVLDAAEPGGYKHTDTARFDRAASKATVREKGRFDNTYEIDVPPGTLDFVALVFHLRVLPLPDGATHTFQVLSGRKVSKVVATVEKREQVTTEAGTFPSVKVRVPTGFDGKFSEKKPTFIWFSDDERRVVVKISADFAVGRAEAQLTSYQPGQFVIAPAVGPAEEPAAPGR